MGVDVPVTRLPPRFGNGIERMSVRCAIAGDR